MKILASSTLLFAYHLEEVFNIAKELGYAGVEVWHFHLIKSGDEKNAKDLCKLAEKLDLSLSLHALSWDLNFTSKLEKVREASLKMLESSLQIASEIKANPVVVHPGRCTIPGDSSEEYWQYLIGGTKRLAAFAEQKGLNIGLEVMEHIPKEFFITPEDANRLISAVDSPNLGITFDAAHVPLEKEPVDYISRMNKVIHVHLSDLTHQKRHIALNTGERDYADLIKYIKSNTQTDLVIEGMEPLRSVQLAKHNIQEINRVIQRVSG